MIHIIAGKTFNGHQEIKNFKDELFVQNGLGKANSTTHDFLMELIKRHSNYEAKVGVGIDFFTIMLNPRSREPCFHVEFTRLDGSVDSISLNDCITAKKRPTQKQQILEAMRHSIGDDIQHFKRNAEQKCNHCGVVGTKFDCDHCVVEFKEMSESFIGIHGVCNSFADVQGFTHFDDDEYKHKWVQYHNEKANLQLLCVSCHKSKTKSKKQLK